MHSMLIARHVARAAAFAVCLAALAAQAERGHQYTLVPITPDATGGGTARGVNDRGDVVGVTVTPGGSGFFSGVAHAFQWRNGTREALAEGSGKSSSAWAVNESGVVAGSIDGTATLWKDGQATSLQFPGEALAINARGDVAGRYWTGGARFAGQEHAFLFRDGVLFDLPALGSFAWATAINEGGVIAGFSQVGNTNVTHAVMWKDMAVTDLGTLGGPQSRALAINDRGDIAGTAEDAAGAFWLVRWNANGGQAEKLLNHHLPNAMNNAGAIVGSDQLTGAGFLYDRGSVTYLTDLPEMKAAGWTAFTPWAINDRGWIVGNAWKPGTAFAGTALLLIPR